MKARKSLTRMVQDDQHLNDLERDTQLKAVIQHHNRLQKLQDVKKLQELITVLSPRLLRRSALRLLLLLFIPIALAASRPETTFAAEPATSKVVIVNDDAVNLRTGPGTSYDSLGKLYEGTKLTLITRGEGWDKVKTPRGTIGWIASEYISSGGEASDPENVERTAMAARPNFNAAQIARRFIGYRYVWGGETPRRGFDCSGLTKYVYARVGIYLPHKAALQVRPQYGKVITKMSSLQAGDLVFFTGTDGKKRGITHVGIYVGNSKIVHAVSPRSGVVISNLNTRYWRAHFYRGLRPRP